MGGPTDLTRLIDSLAAKLPCSASEQGLLSEYMVAAYQLGLTTHQVDVKPDPLRLAVEGVIDDLIESANGLAIDAAWCDATVKALIAARGGVQQEGFHAGLARRAELVPTLVHFGKTLDELTRRMRALENARVSKTKIVDHDGCTFDPKRTNEVIECILGDSKQFCAQITSLQQAVAAIERRQNPLLTSETKRGTASGAIAKSWHTAHELRRVLDELSGWLQTACTETGTVDRQRGQAVNALHELAHDCDAAAVKLQALDADPMFPSQELKDLAVSLGDASALASKTARECT